MRACCVAIVVCVLSVLAVGQCNKEIAAVRETWLKDWNAKQLDGVMSLYGEGATLLPANGSRITGKADIRAYFEKQLGSTITADSVGVDCSDDLAYDSGIYKQDSGGGSTVIGGTTVIGGRTVIGGGGKHVEGNYLVVLKHMTGKWLIVQHASTVKPS